MEEQKNWKQNKLNYIRGYYKKTYSKICLTFRKDTPDEMEMIDFLRAQPSTVNYIKMLVKADMDKRKGGN